MEETWNPLSTLSGPAVAELVGQVYATATPAARCSLLEYLMRPLGVLALLPVGSGVFARIRFLSGRPDTPIGLEYLQHVRTADVMALVEYVMQRSEEILAGLVQLLDCVPGFTQWRECSARMALQAQTRGPGLA